MRFRFFLCLLGWCLLLIGCAACLPAQERIPIGYSGALSGVGASWGLDVRDAMEFANRHLAAGRYQIIAEDDHCMGRDAVSVAHKLIEIHKVKFSFVNCSATVLSAAPVYEAGGVVIMAPLASSSRISQAKAHVFRTIPSDAKAAQVLASYIAKRHGAAGVLTEQTDYAVDFSGDFNAGAKTHGLKVYNEEFISNTADFRPLLLKLKKLGAQALFINPNSEQSFALILKQYHQLKLELPLYGAIIPGSAAFLELAGPQAEGLVFVDFPLNAGNLTPEGLKLFEQYVKEYGAPRSWEIAFATTYEAFRAMHLALESKEDPAEFLHKQRFRGLFGEYSFDKNGDIMGLGPSLRRIENGRAVLVETA